MADKGKQLPKSISSIGKCLKIIGNLREKAGSSKQIFYRGHGQVVPDLAPSLFRKDIYRSKEKFILQEMTSRKSLDFSNDQNMFERLVRAQHYGLPTRLLDVTLSPLVALFFACSSDEEKDGELITITSEKSEIKYYDSHTVSCLANLAHLSGEDQENLKKLKKVFFFDRLEQALEGFSIHLGLKGYLIGNFEIDQAKNAFLSSIKEEYAKNLKHAPHLPAEEYRKNPKKALKKDFRNELECLFSEDLAQMNYFIDKITTESTKKDKEDLFKYLFKLPQIENTILQKSTVGKHLYRSIAEERPGFKNEIELNDLFKTLLVYPKQNNERIVAQQGAFLLFGLHEKLKKEDEDGFGVQRYKIPQDAKKNILEELDWLGINESFIYPELEKLSGHLLKEIKQEKET